MEDWSLFLSDQQLERLLAAPYGLRTTDRIMNRACYYLLYAFAREENE